MLIEVTLSPLHAFNIQGGSSPSQPICFHEHFSMVVTTLASTFGIPHQQICGIPSYDGC
jgi:hypothetical protein